MRQKTCLLLQCLLSFPLFSHGCASELGARVRGRAGGDKAHAKFPRSHTRGADARLEKLHAFAAATGTGMASPTPAHKDHAKIPNDQYEAILAQLQKELVKMQAWVKDKGLQVVIVFEGRDAAGKGGVIKRITEHLNPRAARVVALGAPSDREKKVARGPAKQEGRSPPLAVVVLPKVRAASAHERRDCHLRPLVVQPRGRGARHGLLHGGRVPAVPEAVSAV